MILKKLYKFKEKSKWKNIILALGTFSILFISFSSFHLMGSDITSETKVLSFKEIRQLLKLKIVPKKDLEKVIVWKDIFRQKNAPEWESIWMTLNTSLEVLHSILFFKPSISIKMFFKIFALIFFMIFNHIQYIQAAEKPMLLQFDYSKPVHISGDNTVLLITTDTSQPPSVRILDHGGKSCHMKVSIEEKEKSHAISLINERKNWFSFSQCDPEVAINLPLNKKLYIRIDEIVVNIDGQYEEVEIDTHDLVMNIDGQYKEAKIDADKAVITAFFKDIKSNDKVFIVADTLVAHLGFSKNSKLSYSIEASVSVFSKKIPESYKDSSKITIQANVLQGSIFYK